jgi:hypothetical protein
MIRLLKAVGLRTTRAPLESVHSVSDGVDRALGDDRPGLGRRGQERGVGRRVLVGRELGDLHPFEDGPEPGLGRDGDARLLRHAGRDDPVPGGHPLPGQGVRLGDGDPRHEVLVELVFVLDAGRRLAFEEAPGELLGEIAGVLGLPLDHGPLEVAQHLAFLALDLGLREAEPGHLLALFVEGPEAAGDAAVGDEGREDEDVLRPDETPLARDGPEERRVGLLGDLDEAAVEHGVEEPLDEHPAVVPDRILAGERELVVNGDDALFGLLVRGDGEERVVVVGDGIGRPRRRAGRRRERGEVLLDELLDAGLVEIADGDDGHEVGPVPGPVVALERLDREALDDLLLADGVPVGVAGAAEEDGELLLADALVGALVAAPPTMMPRPYRPWGRT